MAVAPQENGMEEIANDPRGGPELPHAVDAERLLVGALMLNNELFAAAEDAGLSAEHFYDNRHKVLYGAMQKMQAEGRHADPVTVAHLLRESGELRNGGGDEYVAALADIGAAPMNAPAYAKLVRESAMLRAMIDALAQSHIRAFRAGGDPPGKILDEAESRLLAVGDKFSRHAAEMRDAAKVTQQRVDLLAEIVRTRDFDRLRGYSTGFPDLDAKTAGLHGGDLVILAGRPGSGKTALALNIARHVSAEAGVCFFSLEMAAEQLGQRVLSQSGVDAQKLRTGRDLKSTDFIRMAEGAAELKDRDFYIDDSGALNILEAKARTRRLGRRLRLDGKKLGLVVVDYLQLLDSDPDGKSGENRATQVAMISRGLKALARDMNVPIMALSQLNRAVDRTQINRRPMLSDLRESGAIEQDADVVLFLHQEANKVGASEPEEVELIIGKQRNGPVGTVHLSFNKRYSRFVSPAPDSWRGE